MDWLWWLALGALIGWLVEWAIDWWYWRRRVAALEVNLVGAKGASADRARLERDLKACVGRARGLEQELGSLRARMAELEPLPARLAEREAEVVALRAEIAAARLAAPPAPAQEAAPQSDAIEAEEAPARLSLVAPLGAGPHDPLIDINGIGPAYQRRLNAAGVHTFAQLAAMSPEAILAIIKPESWQHIEPEAWAAEAARFAEQVRDGTYRSGRP
jgi:predicted flap endonuclease-1-like 5' DNA nuclease